MGVWCAFRGFSPCCSLQVHRVAAPGFAPEITDIRFRPRRGEIPGFLFSRGEEGQFVFVRAEQFAARPRIHFGDLFMQ